MRGAEHQVLPVLLRKYDLLMGGGDATYFRTSMYPYIETKKYLTTLIFTKCYQNNGL